MADGMVAVRRVYEEPAASDGARILVDRLWPRGVSKERAALTEWLKTIAPSTALREWYGHVPERFGEFARRYRVELEHPEHADDLQHLRALRAAGGVTLLTATTNPSLSEAAVLADLLRSDAGPDAGAGHGAGR